MTECTQVINVTVPQTTEELQERISEHVHEQIVDMPVPIAQPGDQACRGSADAVPRQGCRYACPDAKTGPSTIDPPGDRARRVHTELKHRQGCRSPCGDAATGTSDTEGFEDCESPAGEVHQPSSGRALEEIVEANSAPHERVQQRTVEHRIVEQTVDVPTPQILEEIVKVISAPHERVQQRTVEQQIVDVVSPLSASEFERGRRGGEGFQNVPQERISDWTGEQIDDDIVPVDQPGDQSRCDRGL